jgi:class 3 adenylate cyclase
LVGSTEIAARLDPEEWRATIAAYQRAAADSIERYGGHVAKYLGDGVMAFFGYPEAHDNDAERAARAALAILDAIAQLNEDAARPKLSARIGIDSGPVVVGPGAGTQPDVFGDTPNIAARVQAAAEPGTILITGASHRLVAGLFVVEDCGPRVLKGIERPVVLYQVMHSGGIRGRLHAAAAARGLTPFVGREDELRLLMNRWEGVLDGEGQVVLIVGEAGIGKSRLMRQFHERIAETPYTWVGAATAPFFQNTPFYPVAEMLRAMLARRGDEAADEQLRQLERALELAGLDPGQAIPLLAPLLNAAIQAKYPSQPLAPEQQRRRLLATLVEWVMGICRVQPLVIATEDLHWADPSTLELIQLLVEQGSMTPLMLLCTARPEFRQEWPARAHHTQINLNRLKTQNVRSMVQNVAARRALSEATIATVVERTGGVPLFVEELTRAVIEGGATRPTGREIPVTLHDSLMARLDRLGSAKELAQVGAVIGGEFSYELLHEVYPAPHANLEQKLRDLIDAELLYVRGVAPDATYRFKHALIRDAAYEALLKSRRKELHRMVARAIDEKFPAVKEAHPEVLARHWTEAGEVEAAVCEWQRAAERASKGRAYLEAERHYGDALDLLLTLEESPERSSREVQLQLALGPVLGVTKGWAAADTNALYARVRGLSKRQVNEESLKVISGLWLAAISRSDLREALILAEEMHEVALKLENSWGLVVAAYERGITLHWVGDFSESDRCLLYVSEQFRVSESDGKVLDDYGTYARAVSGINNWMLGYPERARRLTEEARAYGAHEVSFSGALVGAITATQYVLCRDLTKALSTAEKAAKVCAELGVTQYRAGSLILATWARAHMGEVENATATIRLAMAELEATGFLATRQHSQALLAETQAIAGLISESLETANRALEDDTESSWYRPLALTLRGDLQLKQQSPEASQRKLAERDFREAIELSRKMSAKSPELRATTSLARLLRDTGRHAEARTSLAEIYGWFTEGFDTADLRDAKALLDELS